MLKLVETVQAIYAAFGRGDVPAILEVLHQDVDWEYVDIGRGKIPWLQPRRGRANVKGFFDTLAKELEFTRFEPKTFLEGPGVVCALIDFDATVRRNGNVIREVDLAHLWHFDDRGRVTRYRNCADSLGHLTAWGA